MATVTGPGSRGVSRGARRCSGPSPRRSREEPVAKSLVIVESPAKGKTIAGFLGAGYDVKASVGHIRDLPRSGLAIDVDNHFAPEYVVAEGKQKVVADLKRALKDADELILATDEDREGEAIAWHVLEVLKPKV